MAKGIKVQNETSIVNNSHLILGYSKEYVENLLLELNKERTKRKELEEILNKIASLAIKDDSIQDFKKKTLNEKLSESISVLGLERRAYNCLLAESILLVGDLVSKTETDLFKTKHLGRKSLNDINKKLLLHHLTLGFDTSSWIRPEITK